MAEEKINESPINLKSRISYRIKSFLNATELLTNFGLSAEEQACTRFMKLFKNAFRKRFLSKKSKESH